MNSNHQHVKVVGSASNLEFSHMEISKQSCDLIELRADLLLNDLENAIINAKQKQLPVLLTSRDPAEGGNQKLEKPKRISLIEQFHNQADYVDVELANIGNAEYSVWDKMGKLNLCRIASFHDFQLTPARSFLTEKVIAMKEAGADICKIAVMLHSLNDIQTCLDVLSSFPEDKVSIMGMGKLGPASRVILGQAGSVLNYGYLGTEPTAPGQWSSQLLKEALHSSSSLS